MEYVLLHRMQCNAIYRHAHAVILSLSLSFNLIHKLNSPLTAAMQYIRYVVDEMKSSLKFNIVVVIRSRFFPLSSGYRQWVHAMAMVSVWVCVYATLDRTLQTYEIWHIWNDIYEYHCDKGINRNVCPTLQKVFLIFEYWKRRRRCCASIFSFHNTQVKNAKHKHVYSRILLFFYTYRAMCAHTTPVGIPSSWWTKQRKGKRDRETR